MASNYNRKSASSASRKSSSRSGRTSSGSSRSSSRSSSSTPTKRRSQSSSDYSYHAIPGGKYSGGSYGSYDHYGNYDHGGQPTMRSVRVGDIEREQRNKRARRSYRRYVIRFVVAVVLLVALVVGAIGLYYSDAFTIETITVTGVEHLTASEMEQLANVQEGTTLLRVDTSEIEERLLEDAWVEEVTVKRSFPDTLEIIVTERTIAAVVEVPSEDASTTQDWAIASDGMWLMPIPDEDSEAGQNTSSAVYEDAASVLRITDVSYGVDPEVGTYCTDDSINNALDIILGMTTELADQVESVQATEADSTTLILESGIEIVFGEAEDIRDKERVCLEIMEEYPEVVYINVRVVDSPTWRAL